MLAALLGLPVQGTLYEKLEPKLRFENTQLALRSLILAESLQRPLLLHIEDAHWLDPDLLTCSSSSPLARRHTPLPSCSPAAAPIPANAWG